MEADQRPLSRPRVSAMVALLLAFFAAVAWVVRLLPESVSGAVLAFLRRIYVIHQRGHRYAIFPTWRYVTHGPVLRHAILWDSRSDLHQTG